MAKPRREEIVLTPDEDALLDAMLDEEPPPKPTEAELADLADRMRIARENRLEHEREMKRRR